jgi:hypothetical protein
VAKLDQLSKPILNFPADFIAEAWPLSPKDDSERY